MTSHDHFQIAEANCFVPLVIGQVQTEHSNGYLVNRFDKHKSNNNKEENILLETNDIYIDNIYKLINLIINQYGLEKPRPTILKKWILSIENPNGLNIPAELQKIDIWLGEQPTRAKKWKKDWRKRIQAWIYRTKRPQIENNAVVRTDTIEQTPLKPQHNKSSFVHVCGKFCDTDCWFRELTQKVANEPGFIQKERRRLENVYRR